MQIQAHVVPLRQAVPFRLDGARAQIPDGPQRLGVRVRRYGGFRTSSLDACDFSNSTTESGGDSPSRNLLGPLLLLLAPLRRLGFPLFTSIDLVLGHLRAQSFHGVIVDGKSFSCPAISLPQPIALP